MNTTTEPIEPTTTDMVRELLHEVADYGRDLARLAGAEWKEKSHSLRTLAVMGASAALVLFTSFMLLTVALVGVIAYGLDSWRWALLIVGVGYGIIGLLSLIPALIYGSLVILAALSGPLSSPALVVRRRSRGPHPPRSST